ncbi:MAG: acyl-CoA/acyl-ACP dehydrogenase [Myxococcales bacterium]|nr:acyl-CoA/acyl-ACP dehydrogenase [Myxococcales bacterium]
MMFSTRILDRKLGVVAGDAEQWRALEDELEVFCASIAADPVDERDEDAATREYVRRLAAAGLLRHVVPAAYGGASPQLRTTALCLVRQWLARRSGALDSAFVMQGLGSYAVTLGGDEALRAQLLPRVVAGEVICAFALTEPEAGSDVAAMTTTATPGPDGGVVLDGEKCFISNAPIAGSYVVFAREAAGTVDAAQAGGKPRYGAFWVPGDAPGLSVDPIHVIAPHPIGTVKFRGVVVPAAHRLGKFGDGLKLAFSTLDVFRISVGGAALGLADRALEETVTHLKRRVQFGKPLATQQGLRFLVAEVATEHVAAQMLVYRAAGARDRGDAAPEDSAVAKLFATEVAQRVIDRAVQSLGGLGVTVGQATERLYREIRALRIYEGTSEIQKLVIARALFDGG